MDRGLTYGGHKYRSLKTATLYVFRTAFFLLLWILLQNNVSAQVTADFSASVTQGCSPLVVCFTDLSAGNPDTWLWSFGNSNFSPDRNPCAIYIAPGTYTVSLTASNGSGSDTKTVNAMITVFANPTVNFSASNTTGCAPETIAFTDLTALGDAPLVSWRWDFGDGNTSTQQHPVNTYTNPGVYTVVLEVIDANGCTHSKSINNMITILATPIVDFSVSGGSCTVPANLTFTDHTSGTMITGYFWNFGDGTTSTLQNPTHTYSSAGPYAVSLTVTNSAGCTGTKTMNNVSGAGGIQADFSVDDTAGCGSVSANFTDQSTSSGTIISWTWDFGDGGTSSVQNTTHNYTVPGTYDVSLTVTDNNGCSNTIVYNDLIRVYVRPTANFTADKTQGCVTPFMVSFTETATNDVSWLWEFGDGTTSTLQNPSHSYASPGSYGVRLTVTSADGCTRTHFKANYIKITNPSANFWADATSGCLDLTVNFHDQTTSSVAVTSWNWSFGDGATSTLQNPSHTYTTTGVFDVRLIITNADGCVDTTVKTGYISAGEAPNVNFGSDKQFACLGTPIAFYDSSDTGDAWLWDFGDGNTDTSRNPVYTYGHTGLFNVTLIVYSSGCSDTLTRSGFVTISPPKAGFIASHSCDNPFEVTFTDTSLGPNVWHWDFGDGFTSTNPDNVHTFASTGNYSVRLAVEETNSGCKDTTTRVIRVTDPVADFSGSPLTGCYPLIVYFTSASVDADTYQWFFGDGDTSSQENPIKVYDSSGIYDVTLIITDIHGCTDTIVKNDYVTVLGANAWFAADTLFGCTPLKVDYNDSSTSFLGTVTSWLWDFGDNDTSALQNPSKIYTEPGIYSIGLRVTDSNGCADSVLRVNYIVPTYPAPNFYADDTVVCVGEDVHFSNLSIGVGMNFLWDFGDGNISADSLPVHAYSSEGIYTVSLKATDVNGCDSTLVRPLYIRVVQPHAAMTVDSAFASCPPLWSNFTDLTPAADSIVAWLWSFGDAQTSDLQHPTHVYTESDTFYPSLMVTDFNGCKDTVYHTPIIVMGPRGTFDFIQDKWCVPVPVPFFSDAADTMIHIYDYGDGNVGVRLGGDTIVHDYTYPGIFHPSLILDDGHGCIISIDHPDSIVTFTAVADFSSDLTFICHASMVHFYDSSWGVLPPVSWFWDFGDGTTSTVQHPSHYYSIPGTYDVMLVITNPQGCTDTIIKPHYISVDPGPAADFVTDTAVCVPETITFTDASVSDTSIAIASWQWDFGDGGTSTEQNPAHTYTTVGTFSVMLIIETVAGCGDTISKTIVTHGPPTANAGPDKIICTGDIASLTGSGGVRYLWSPAVSLSDSAVSNPSAFPDSTTTYTLTVFDSRGCLDTDEVTVFVNPFPAITLSADTGICYTQSYQIIAAGTGSGSIAWTPSSTLSCSDCPNPLATPDSTTTYVLTVSTPKGCDFTDSVTVTVRHLEARAMSSDTIACVPATIQFTDLSAAEGTIIAWHWNFGDGTASNAQHPQHDYNTAGIYPVTLTIQSSYGCIDSVTNTIGINPLPIANAGPDITICTGDTTALSASGGITYRWFPAAFLSDSTVPNPRAYPSDTTDYVVVVSDKNGCVDTDTVRVNVNPLPAVTVTSDDTICATSRIQLNAAGGVTYSWSPANSLSDPTIPNPTAFPIVQTTYTVLVTDANGCQNTGVINISVNPLPAVYVSPDTTVCIGSSAQLRASGGESYLWSPDSSLSCAGCPDPVALPTVTTTYRVNVTNGLGCMATRYVTVTVLPLPAVIAGPDTAVCRGASVQLFGSGAGSGGTFRWSPSAGLSISNISNPVATPDITTYYKLTFTDANGCKNSDSVFIVVNDFPVITISAGSSLCYGDSTQLEATGGYSYSWTPATGLSNPNISNPVARPLLTTVYVVEAATQSGCTTKDSVLVVVRPKPTLVVKAADEICLGDSTQFAVSGAEQYEWHPATGLSCFTCSSPVAKPVTSTTYLLRMTDAYNCIWYDTIPLIVNPLPQVHTTDDKTICKGEQVELTTRHAGATSFEWMPPYGLNFTDILSPIASPQQTTEYVVIARNEFACPARDTVVINVIDRVHSTVTDNLQICAGSSVTLESRIDVSGISGAQVIWLPQEAFSDPTQFTQIITPGTSATYMLVVFGGACVPDTQYVNVVVHENPDVDAGEDQLVMAGTRVNFAATSNYNIVTWYWSPSAEMSCYDCRATSVIANESRTYYVNVTDENGCPAMDSVSVKVIRTCEGDIWVPNAFTPNGDEVNDKFMVRSTGFAQLVYFRVFDRWGNLVYITDDINQGWDGKYHGAMVNPDVYVWWVRASCPDGTTINLKGNVTAIR